MLRYQFHQKIANKKSNETRINVKWRTTKSRHISKIFFLLLFTIAVNAQRSANENSSAPKNATNSTSTAQQANDSSINIADPTVFYDEGTYYLYGTVEGNSNQGFLVYTSKDMKSWKIAAEAKDVIEILHG